MSSIHCYRSGITDNTPSELGKYFFINIAVKSEIHTVVFLYTFSCL